MNSGSIEKVAQFGVDRGLMGILTLPAQRREGAPTIVILNSGIIHRVGSNRVSVLLARAFATLGFATLRFDLSGIGDSERRGGGGSLQDAVERDIAEALDFCTQAMGSGEFVLVGLCSGAYDALHSAGIDRRVVGVFMVDFPGPFLTRAHTLHHLRERLLKPASWRNPLRKLSHYYVKLTQESQRSAEQTYVIGARSRASREWMDEHLAETLGRGVRLCFVFTRGSGAVYNHESQFRDAFPEITRHPTVSYSYFHEADHAFTSARERERLVATARRWLEDSWPHAPNRAHQVEAGVGRPER